MKTQTRAQVRTIGAALSLVLFAAGCDVSSPPGSTGGVKFDAGGGDAGPLVQADAGSTCERGVVIVTSDYKSTNIVVSALDGTTRSGSFVSSGATKPGLTLALSGDVDVPAAAPASKRVVLLDRFGTDVVTWMNLDDASVLAQLAIGTGFESNPHDYLEVDATRAFVSRYGTNTTPGQQPFDQGGDLLILDTVRQTILGRIAMPEENAALLPCPDGMTWLGGEVAVNLVRFSADFSQAGDGRFVGVSPVTGAVDWTVDIPGLKNCGRVVTSPSGALAAVACSSLENATTSQFDPTQSDIVIYDATLSPPKEVRRLGVGVKLGAGLQQALAFATEDAIFALTYGGNATPGDTAFAVSATTGAVTPLGQATMPYVFGGVHCSPGCGGACLLADAERNKLRRWQVAADGTFTAMDDQVVDTVVGLPPRTIGGL